MEIKNLIAFREVARTRSFTQAAESLNYAQSTITTQIKVLEEELGAPLFDRVGKRIMLTSLGERLLIYAEQLTNLEAEARIMLSNAVAEPAGSLAINASDTIITFVLPRIARIFRQRYPLVNLTINLPRGANPVEGIQAGDADIAIMISLPMKADLHYEPVAVARCSFVAAPDHPLAAKDTITPADLDQSEFFFRFQECPYRALFDGTLARFNAKKATNFELKNAQEIKQWVMLGMGVTLFADFSVARELACGDLVRLNWQETDLSLPILLVWHQEKWLSPDAEAFRQLVREMLVKEPYLEPVGV